MLVLAFLVGWIVWPESYPDPVVHESTTAPRDRPSLDTGTEGPEAVHLDSDEARVLGSTSRADLSSAEPGSVVITVVDLELVPLPGSEVYSYAPVGRQGARAYARLAHDPDYPGTRHLGTTGGDGALKVPIRDLPERCSLRATTAEGAIGQAEWTTPQDAETILRVNISVDRGRQVLIRARDEATGGAIPDATVVATWSGPNGVEVFQTLRTDSAGSCVVSLNAESRRFQVILESPQYRQCSQGPFDAPLPSTVSLEASRGAEIRGRVFDAQGTPAPGLEVVGWNVLARVRAGDVVADLSSNTWSKMAVTGQDGRFALTGLQDGMPAALAVRTALGPVLNVVRPGPAEVRIDLPAAGVLRGAVDVARADGKVAVINVDAPGWPPVALVDVGDAGEFECRLLEGRYGLLYAGEGRFGTAGPFEVDQTTGLASVEIPTQEAWSLDLGLASPDGTEVGDGWASIRLPSFGALSPEPLGPKTWSSLLVRMADPWEQSVTGGGAPEFPSLPAGNLRFRVGASGMTTRDLEIEGAPGESAARNLEVADAIRARLRLTLFGEPVSGHRVSLRAVDLGEDEPIAERIPTRNGVAEFPALRPGTWDVTIHVATGPVGLGQVRFQEDGELVDLALDAAFPSRLEVSFKDPARQPPRLTPQGLESCLERSWKREESEAGVVYTRTGLTPGSYLLWSAAPSDGVTLELPVGLTKMVGGT